MATPPRATWADPDELDDARPHADANGVDWSHVRQLKDRVTDHIETRLAEYRDRRGKDMPAADRQVMGKGVTGQAVDAWIAADTATTGARWTPQARQALHKAVFDSYFGFGRLQPLFEIPTAEDITINGHDSVAVRHTDGRVEHLSPVAENDTELSEAVQFMAASAQPPRAFDANHPDVTLMIGDRFRVHAVSGEVSVRPSIAIRQHHLTNITLADLADRDLFPVNVAQLLDAAVLANMSVVVAGDVGAGKTTLLRALVDAVPPTDRFATLETDLELFAHLLPGRENNLALFSRAGMGELNPDGSQAGEIDVTAMIPWALRQMIQRLIIGEVRGVEAAAMFDAMVTGAGAMCTIHAKSADEVADRLALLVAQNRVLSIAEAHRQIAMSLDLIVHISRVNDTWRGGGYRRYVSKILAVQLGEDYRPAYETVYQANPDATPATFNPPAFLTDRTAPYHRELRRTPGDRR